MGKFICSTNVYWNLDITKRINEIRNKKVWIVCDQFLTENLYFIEYRKQLKKENQVKVFSDIIPDPPLSKVMNGIYDYLDYLPDVIVAIGGGSAIDTAKSISYFIQELNLDTKKKLIAVPTTSGTGSEVTSVAVVTDTEENSKYPIVSNSILPDEAWLDANFIASCPERVIANSGMDVLTHALEALVAKDANSFTDSLAIHAAADVFAYLSKSYRKTASDAEVMLLHQASCMAGSAFQNAGLGICHAISHQLGGLFHLPHGLLNSLLLPKVILCNSQDDRSREKYASLSKQLYFADSEDSDIQAVEKLVQQIEMLKSDLENNQTLKSCSVDQNALIENIEKIIFKTKNDFTYTGNIYAPTDQEIAQIILSIY